MQRHSDTDFRSCDDLEQQIEQLQATVKSLTSTIQYGNEERNQLMSALQSSQDQIQQLLLADPAAPPPTIIYHQIAPPQAQIEASPQQKRRQQQQQQAYDAMGNDDGDYGDDYNGEEGEGVWETEGLNDDEDQSNSSQQQYNESGASNHSPQMRNPHQQQQQRRNTNGFSGSPTSPQTIIRGGGGVGVGGSPSPNGRGAPPPPMNVHELSGGVEMGTNTGADSYYENGTNPCLHRNGQPGIGQPNGKMVPRGVGYRSPYGQGGGGASNISPTRRRSNTNQQRLAMDMSGMMELHQAASFRTIGGNDSMTTATTNADRLRRMRNMDKLDPGLREHIQALDRDNKRLGTEYAKISKEYRALKSRTDHQSRLLHTKLAHASEEAMKYSKLSSEYEFALKTEKLRCNALEKQLQRMLVQQQNLQQQINNQCGVNSVNANALMTLGTSFGAFPTNQVPLALSRSASNVGLSTSHMPQPPQYFTANNNNNGYGGANNRGSDNAVNIAGESHRSASAAVSELVPTTQSLLQHIDTESRPASVAPTHHQHALAESSQGYFQEEF